MKKLGLSQPYSLQTKSTALVDRKSLADLKLECPGLPHIDTLNAHTLKLRCRFRPAGCCQLHRKRRCARRRTAELSVLQAR